ncbi:hypothetical protein LZ554_007814 [Drepanopeziza brunnea f. sp. 'monogermtubi']|nr:hypothetical protein LZ554_007814 [Drepanopeziza brunnea f. sp. 'monogermtubi']
MSNDPMSYAMGGPNYPQVMLIPSHVAYASSNVYTNMSSITKASNSSNVLVRACEVVALVKEIDGVDLDDVERACVSFLLSFLSFNTQSVMNTDSVELMKKLGLDWYTSATYSDVRWIKNVIRSWPDNPAIRASTDCSSLLGSILLGNISMITGGIVSPRGARTVADDNSVIFETTSSVTTLTTTSIFALCGCCLNKKEKWSGCAEYDEYKSSGKDIIDSPKNTVWIDKHGCSDPPLIKTFIRLTKCSACKGIKKKWSTANKIAETINTVTLELAGEFVIRNEDGKIIMKPWVKAVHDPVETERAIATETEEETDEESDDDDHKTQQMIIVENIKMRCNEIQLSIKQTNVDFREIASRQAQLMDNMERLKIALADMVEDARDHLKTFMEFCDDMVEKIEEAYGVVQGMPAVVDGDRGIYEAETMPVAGLIQREDGTNMMQSVYSVVKTSADLNSVSNTGQYSSQQQSRQPTQQTATTAEVVNPFNIPAETTSPTKDSHVSSMILNGDKTWNSIASKTLVEYLKEYTDAVGIPFKDAHSCLSLYKVDVGDKSVSAFMLMSTVVSQGMSARSGSDLGEDLMTAFVSRLSDLSEEGLCEFCEEMTSALDSPSDLADYFEFLMMPGSDDDDGDDDD